MGTGASSARSIEGFFNESSSVQRDRRPDTTMAKIEQSLLLDYDVHHTDTHVDDAVAADGEPRRTTNLQGIMSYTSKNASKMPSALQSPAIGMKSAVYDANKKHGLSHASQLADDIDKSFTHMMSLISTMQHDTGMTIKTADLEREYCRVYNRIKVIAKL